MASDRDTLAQTLKESGDRHGGIGYNLRYWGPVADDMIAAGWRPPARAIETDAELNDVPAGIVVRAKDGTIAARHPSGVGVVFGDDRPFPWSVLRAPATVLYEPGQEAQR